MNIGDFVKIEFGISDRLNRQGQFGKVVKIKEIDDDELEVWVLFSDGETGKYFENCLIKIK